MGTGGQAGSTCGCCTEPRGDNCYYCFILNGSDHCYLFTVLGYTVRPSGIQDLSWHSAVGHLRMAGLVADLAVSPENPTLCFLSLPLMQTVLSFRPFEVPG